MFHSLTQVLAAAKLISRPTGATISELQEKLDVSRRSIYRALGALDRLGYPYYRDKEHDDRYRLVEPERSINWWLPVPAVSFDLEDRVLLDYLFDSAARDSAIAEKLKELQRKLALIGASAGYALAPKESGAGELSHQPRLFSSVPAKKASYPEVARYLELLLGSINLHHVCELSYESRESAELKTYRIHPLAVFESEGGFYCFIEVPNRNSIRIIALERVRELKELSDFFDPPSDFDAGKRLADPFGIIQGELFLAKLAFSEEQALYVRDFAWPADYIFEKKSDGRVLMSFETRGAFGLKRWILGWGSAVEVLEPAWLRNEIANELRETIRCYS